MNKKGTHVDWVISMGIFIIYIIVLFILLRPGVRPIYRPTFLLDSLESKFYEQASWVVKQVPLFVRICKPVDVNTPTTINVDDTNNYWTEGRTMKGTEPASLPIQCVPEDDSTWISNAVFDIYFYQNLEPFDLNFYPDLVVIGCEKSTESACDAELGIVEDIKGLKRSVVSDMVSSASIKTDYDSLKRDLGIPSAKEFAIHIDEGVDGSFEYEIEYNKPYEQANVFVRRIDDQFVDSNGKTSALAVYLKIW